MGHAISGELLDKSLDARAVLVDGLDDLCRLNDVPSRKARLPVKKNGERAADNEQHEQQRESLAAQRGDLIRKFGVRVRRCFRIIHGGHLVAGLACVGCSSFVSSALGFLWL